MAKKAKACAARLKVLSDDTRLAVIRLLLKGPRHVQEMNASLKVGQSLLSHHLQILRKAGLVVSRRDGKAVLYSLASSVEGTRKGEAIDLGCCLISFD